MKQYTLTIEEIRKETRDSITLCFKQPGLRKIRYQAGLFITLILRINARKCARPKPILEIGRKPILFHIPIMHENFGYTDYLISLGYKATFIKECFYNYYLNDSDTTNKYVYRANFRTKLIIHKTL